MSDARAYDVVLFGATGFTGGLTAEYLAEHAPEGLRLALAGRNIAKLEAVRERLGLPDLPLLQADVGDAASIRELAGATRVVVTTVGPYIRYGEPLVQACAEMGTDYLDLTGEPEFVDLMWLRHHRRAQETGARLIHCCGFDSIPHDLGAYFTVRQLPEGVPLKVEGFVRGGGRISGGTLHSAIGAFAHVRQMATLARQRHREEGSPPGRVTHTLARPPRRDPSIGGWSVPLPTIDPQIVLRSARALDRYGPDFSYGHYGVVPNVAMVAGAGAGAAGLLVAAQIPPVRRWLLGRIDPGEGPTPEQRARAWFNVRFVGEGAGKRVVCEVSGKDPGYGETSKMLAEAALCIACDELPETAGQVTTAQAMGDALIARLQAAGISFSVREPSAAASAAGGAAEPLVEQQQ